MGVRLDPAATAAQVQATQFAWCRSPEQDAATPARHPVVIVGAGPVGLTLAIDLAQRGQRVVLLDNDDKLSTGSRAICFAKRTLEIWDRLGVAEPLMRRGVGWHTGRVFLGERELYHFDLLPEPGHERPAFINLQQYFVEAALVQRALALPGIDLRWRHEVVAVEALADGAQVEVQTPESRYRLHADWLVACDGARSPVRRALGLEARGRSFRDRFLIADVTMDAAFPAERRFWFDPPFHPGQSVLLHRQSEGVWRIDFQLGWDADPELEQQPQRILARVRALLAASGQAETRVELVWASVYSFACERMERFVHGRVLFAGDAAHRVSPFGARGANSGVQDADNLGWKLDAVLRSSAGPALIDSYGLEREAAADENLRVSSRSTDFITPKSEVSRLFRDAVLGLAREHGFARALVNSGRLSTPSTYRHSPLNGTDEGGFAGGVAIGAPPQDAPTAAGWLLRRLPADFVLLAFGPGVPAVAGLARVEVGADEALAWQRWDARTGSAYLLRPDGHVAARWRAPTADTIRAAWRRALNP